ncbi:MAG: hypothetical protein M0Q93_00130 [Terrimicrobiaceae bacterium]|jgi:hypothetical protein|nr:hypothetical protein [Terrimicrobiaceae bacterium]
MNRAEKLKKLENAVKEYRGTYHPNTKKWIRPPKVAAKLAIQKYCELLGIDFEAAILSIDNFQTFAQMRTWFSSIV